MNSSHLKVEAGASTNNDLLTELVFSGQHGSSASVLLPMLAHLSRQCKDRWITWISPEGISKAELEHYGFDTSKLRLIKASAEDKLWVLWDALSKGTSATVIAHFNHAERQDLKNKTAIQELERAAATGNTRGVLLSHI